MPESAPSQEWIDAVCDCLRSADRRRILITLRAMRDWEAIFPAAFLHDLYAAIAFALASQELEAERVDGMADSGDIYAFFFYHRTQKLYGKIGLRPDGNVVTIYSAHRPQREML